MTEAANINKDSVVLEIGTGSGYQAAILGAICKEVYSIEVIEELAVTSTKIFDELGYKNIHVRVANGYNGWPEKAPFDAIIVTAAAKELPKPLLEQLKLGAKLVIPVGEYSSNQELLVITKTVNGFEKTSLFPVAFVPFV
jgi:protein-L-isoaspartate(D-aspartate) O-methyltransferase